MTPAQLAAALRNWMADPRQRSHLSLLHGALHEARAFDSAEISKLCDMLNPTESALLVIDGILHLAPDQRAPLETMRQALVAGRSDDELAQLQISWATPWAMGPFFADGWPLAVPRR